MEGIKALLQGEYSPGIYRLEESASYEQLAVLIQAHGFHLFYIDLKQVSGKADFLTKSAIAMQFPKYFNKNWDAYEECIRDLGWCKAKGYILLYDNIDSFVENEPLQWKVALEILESTIVFWNEIHTSMYVLLKGNTPAVSTLESV